MYEDSAGEEPNSSGTTSGEEVESDSWTFNCLLQVLSLKLPSHMSVTIHESHE